MHLNQLVYYLAVAETGSINAASKKCFVSQQAINMSLRKLETELHTTLLQSNHKGVTLTPQGHIFAAAAQDMVQRYETALAELERFETSGIHLSGTLSIFSASIFTDSFLPEVIRKFMQFYPNTMIKIIETNHEELLSYVLHGYCDLAFLSAGKPYVDNAMQQNPSERVRVTTLLEDHQVMVALPEHPLIRNKERRADFWQQYSTTEKVQISLYQTLPVTRIEESYACSISNSTNAELHKKLIRDGVVVTFMPNLAYKQQFQQDGFACRAVPNAQPINHVMIYRENPEKAEFQLLQSFLKFVQKEFEQRFGSYTEKNV